MRKRIASAAIGLLVLCVLLGSGFRVSAAEGQKASEIQKVSVQSEVLGLFGEKYVVTAEKVSMRSGPGYRYPVAGILYKNDILWVRSIRNGWARFKVNGRWRYISERSIKRDVERVFWFHL